MILLRRSRAAAAAAAWIRGWLLLQTADAAHSNGDSGPLIEVCCPAVSIMFWIWEPDQLATLKTIGANEAEHVS